MIANIFYTVGIIFLIWAGYVFWKFYLILKRDDYDVGPEE